MAQVLFDQQYPEAMRAREREFLDTRRAARGIGRGLPVVGVALSGGGIRSATFVLGFFQGLAARIAGSTPTLLQRIDLLSTVSGGGYFGAFLGALFTRQTAAGVEAELRDSSSQPIRWLRENGRYLAPNGAGDSALAGAIVLRNWVALAVVMCTAVLTAMTAAHLVRIAGRDILERQGEAGEAAISLALIHEATAPTFGVYWSPYLFPAALVLLFAAVPLGWAYWLGRLSNKTDHLWVWGTTIVVGLAAGLGRSILGQSIYRRPLSVLAVLVAETLGLSLIFSLATRVTEDDPFGDRAYRNRLSRAMTGCLLASAALAALGVVDTFGQTLYVLAFAGAFQQKTIGALGGGFLLLLTALQRLVKFLDAALTSKRARVGIGMIAALVAIVVSTVVLSGLSAFSHGIARHWEKPSPQSECVSGIDVSLSSQNYITVKQKEPCPAPVLPRLDWRATLKATGLLLVISFFFGRSLPFVNLSSLSQFYSARLSRTYIGASNQNRQAGAGVNLTTEIAGDDLAMDKYRPYESGGPLHFINVTLNETIGGRSQIEDRDRKGLALAMGPAGVSVAVTHHATWDNPRGPGVRLSGTPAGTSGSPMDFHVWGPQTTPKRLSLSQWIAVSGAAVAPGMGAQTSLSLSVLLAMGNVRLGYWWDSGVSSQKQAGTPPKPSVRLERLLAWAFPVQSAFVQELLARFYGPHQTLWFLSDGGHFENTACYELLRRRVPLIIVCDDGADPDYAMADLANLTRKARIDFGAELRLLPPLGPLFGTVADLQGTKTEESAVRFSTRHMIAAQVIYPDEGQIALDGAGRGRAQSLIIVVKPSLTGDEPLDVLQYAVAHPTFPQERTADQFFDEAQWESYRKLGEHIGAQLSELDLEKLFRDLPTSA